MVLKISVLGSGAVLVNGEPSEIERLDHALDALQAERDVVWYYRQATSKSAAVGMSVIQKITARKLSISLSSRSDFSDYLDDQGVSRPRGQDVAGSGPQLTEDRAVSRSRQYRCVFSSRVDR